MSDLYDFSKRGLFSLFRNKSRCDSIDIVDELQKGRKKFFLKSIIQNRRKKVFILESISRYEHKHQPGQITEAFASIHSIYP